MKQTTLAALAMSLSRAQLHKLETQDAKFDLLITHEDQEIRPLLLRYPKQGPDISVQAFREMTIPNNQKVFFKTSPMDGSQYAYTPNLKGGAIEYTVDLSETECGCVAGAYAMAISGGCDPEAAQSGKPHCPTIDIMQANQYGFNVAANPCDGGVCDPISQCQYRLKEEGIKKYGDWAYGPHGEIIDTNEPFQVMTQFISDTNYFKVWKMKTVLTQGSTPEQRQIEMEADCSDYLDKMSDMHLSGGMGFVFSAWDNQDRRVPLDFELDDMCGDKPMNTCDRAKNVISDFAVYQSGYTEDKPFDPTELLPFKADSDFYGPNAEFYLNGLPGQNLTATDRTITMGENNRAFVLDTQQDDSTYWAYYHQYIGGSVQFDVDVSAVMCDSVAGVYLAALDDDQCSWDVKAAGVKPNCQSIDLMEANIYGFAQAAHPDADCDHCKHREWGSSQGTMNYGPSRRAIINSMEPYNVKIQFYTDKYQGDLISIKTTMSQFDKVHEFSLECGEKFDAFKDTLSGQMGLAISSYHAGKDNEVGGPCPPSDNPKPTSVIGNIIWTENDSIMGTD